MIIAAHWYDLSKNRRVEFQVDYSLDGDNLDVNSILPTALTFYRPGTDTVERRIQVHTAKGRELLIDQLFDSGEAYNLTLSLARRHGLLTA